MTGKVYSEQVLDSAVELGIDRVRIGIMSGLAENPIDYYQLFIDNNQDVESSTSPAVYAAVRATGEFR